MSRSLKLLLTVLALSIAVTGCANDGTDGADGQDAVSPADLWVDASWAGLPADFDPDGFGPANAMGTDAFATIQEAIDAASAGQTIAVLAGTYSVDTVINVNVLNLTISGAGANATIIDGSPKNGIIVNGQDLLFNVSVSGVTIEGMTIDLGNDDADFDVGVFAPNDASVDNLTVRNCILVFAAFLAGAGAGEQLIHLGGGDGHTVQNNSLEAASANSTIYLGENTNTNLTISNNVIGPVAAGVGGSGDADGGGTSVNSFGPIVTATISGNTFTDTGIAVYIGADFAGTGTDTEFVTISGNTFTSASGFLATYGALVITSEVDGVNTQNISVTGNTFTGTETSGAITIFDTTIPATPNVIGTTITVTGNSFAGDNAVGGLVLGDGVTGGAASLDSTGNWWGAADGPSGCASCPGTGDAIVEFTDGTVDYSSFLTAAP